MYFPTAEGPDTSTGPGTPRPGSALRHQGVLYRDPVDLVDLVAPALAAGLERGHAVAAIVDDETAGRLRERVGPDADRIEFTEPAVAFADPPQTMVARRRRAAATACGERPLTVLGQFQPWMRPRDVAFWESMFNLVLADLPVTLLCACPYDAGAAAHVVSVTHPELRTGAAAVPNAGFRDPLAVLAEHPPPPPPALGAPTGTMTFVSAADLAGLRVAVGAYAQVAGLGADRVGEVVFAVSEIASNCLEHGAGHGRLRMWVGGGELTWEVHDPGRVGSDLRDPARHAPARLGLAPPAQSAPRGRGLWATRELCDSLHVWPDGAGTSVRGTVGN